MDIIGGRCQAERYLFLSRSRRPVELFYIPKQVMVEHSWPDSFDGIFHSHKNIWAHQANDRVILRNDLLNSIIKLLSLLVVQGRHLLLHKTVEFSLPWC